MPHPQFSRLTGAPASPTNVVTLRFRETRLAAPRAEPTFTAPREAARAAARAAAGFPSQAAARRNPFMPQTRPAESILMDFVMLLTVIVFIAGVYAALEVFA